MQDGMGEARGRKGGRKEEEREGVQEGRKNERRGKERKKKLSKEGEKRGEEGEGWERGGRRHEAPPRPKAARSAAPSDRPKRAERRRRDRLG